MTHTDLLHVVHVGRIRRCGDELHSNSLSVTTLSSR